jgi:hypothetical protein
MEEARPKRPTEVIASALSDLISGKPVDVEQAIGALENFVSQRMGARPARPSVHPGPRSRPSVPQVDQHASYLLAARAVLEFTPSQVLTADAIKERKRMLAKRHHPDRGGSAARMAAINDAADILLESL